MSNKHQELASIEANGFCKEFASPKQTALGKEISNLLMAGRLSKITLPTSAAGEELSVAKQKLMLLDITAEGRLMLLSHINAANVKCYC
nr:hypothetical protein [Tanacetum cinerariifolium]